MSIIEVYLLDDKVWIYASVPIENGTKRLYVASHRQKPTVITREMVNDGEVPQEVIEWYQGE